jgi:hypothetical protein
LIDYGAVTFSVPSPYAVLDPLLTTHLYMFPLSDADNGGVVYDEPVAPSIFVPSGRGFIFLYFPLFFWYTEQPFTFDAFFHLSVIVVGVLVILDHRTLPGLVAADALCVNAIAGVNAITTAIASTRARIRQDIALVICPHHFYNQ